MQGVLAEEMAQWQAGMYATLLFVVQEQRVLLIEKLRGIGAGKVNAPGGKIEPGESALQAILRETREEICVEVSDAKKVGELWFSMSDMPNIHCQVFVAASIVGEPCDTEEAIPFWCELTAIPYERMWQDDALWLPLLLQGKQFCCWFDFDKEQMLGYKLEEHSRSWRYAAEEVLACLSAAGSCA